jgi:small subunit ribosomal protein S8
LRKEAKQVTLSSPGKYNVAIILETAGWIWYTDLFKGGDKGSKNSNFDQLRIVLRYKKNGKPYISNLKKISKPGLKVYVKKDKIPKVLNGFGLAIVSTSSGIMTGGQAKKFKVGGELICKIY